MVDINYKLAFFLLLFTILISCNNEKEITRLLKSNDKENIILGAYKAGESKEKKYVILLLENTDDKRVSINIRFKGFSVYQEKMIALKKIFATEPPKEITAEPDSIIINFYTNLMCLDSSLKNKKYCN